MDLALITTKLECQEIPWKTGKSMSLGWTNT
jgi:hypothetical protein